MKIKELIERLQKADPDGDLEIFVAPLIAVNNMSTNQPEKTVHPEIKYLIEHIIEVKDIFSDTPSRFIVLGFDDSEYINNFGETDSVN